MPREPADDLYVRPATKQARAEEVTELVERPLVHPDSLLKRIEPSEDRLTGGRRTVARHHHRAFGSLARTASSNTGLSMGPMGTARSCPDFGVVTSLSESARRTRV